MSDIPAVGYPSDNARTEAEMKAFFDDVLNVLNEIPGGGNGGELTISAGSVTPTAWTHALDTEGDAAADDLDNIAITNHPESRLLLLRIANDARRVTLKHNSGGDGQIIAPDGLDIVMRDTAMFVMLLLIGTSWYVLWVGQGKAVRADSGYETVRFKNHDVITTGSSWVVPAGVYNILVRAWGPGGGGGKGDSASGNCGGGGGGGAYVERLCPVEPGDTLVHNVTVANGAGATADGGNGTSAAALIVGMTGTNNDFSMSADGGDGGSGGSGSIPGRGGRGGQPSGDYDIGIEGGAGMNGDANYGGTGGTGGFGGGAGGRGQSGATDAADGQDGGGGGGGSDTGDAGDGASALLSIFY